MALTIGIIGGGAWGTALGNLMAAKGWETLLWAREEEVVRSINERHENTAFLKGVTLHKGLKATTSLKEVLRESGLLISAVPAQFVRGVFEGAGSFLPKTCPIVSVSKGIEIRSLKLMKDVFGEVLPGTGQRQLAFLSGPTFAKEVAQGLPAAATVASLNPAVARKVQEILSGPFFKLYLSADVVGVEVGGAIKNVIAIAAGIVDGLGLGHSALASMMTRGLNEMTRLGLALGAEPLTFLGLAGLGDLILTCTGGLSRNRSLGLGLAAGKKPGEILGSRNAVTEGVATAEAVHKLSEKLALDLPICEEVYQILYHDKTVSESIKTLAARALKEELEGIKLPS